MSIKSKLIFLFLALTLIPLIFVSVITFDKYKKSLEAIHLAQLEDLVTFKAGRIEAHLFGLMANIEMAQDFYNIKKNLPLLIQFANEPTHSEFLGAKDALDKQLRKMQVILNLSGIILTNTEGRVVYASNPKYYTNYFSKFLPDPEQKAFAEGKTRVYFSDVFMNQAQGNTLEMLLTAPALDLNGAFIGVIAFEVDMAPVYKLIQETTGLGNTGEALVGKVAGNEVIYLSPLRHDPQAALKRHVHIGESLGGPIQEAAQGKAGSGQLLDYRGKKVVAAWRYIPSLGWGMVAKIDASEVFQDVINLRNLVLMILLIVSALSAVIGISIAQSVSGPIKKLYKGSQIVGSGNLDYKVGINSKDEIGQLSRAFDKMTHNLKTVLASRDELDKEIVERKQAEEELRRSNESLEQFAYVASHDLQEPLRVMASYSQLLERRYKNKLDQDADDFIAFIVDAANRMQRLINDLLNYSRIGRKDGSLTEVDCNVVLRKVLESMAAIIESGNGRVTFELLPVLKGHESGFAQLFQNLIGNALKFRGKEPPIIHISAKQNAEEWEFCVKDNGIGIDPQYNEKIFLIFQRLHSKEEYPGTGIGLSICKKIVENYGGRIWVESEPQKGSSFYFTIPIRK